MYACPHCYKIFKKKIYLNRHIARIHGNTNEQVSKRQVATQTAQSFEVQKPKSNKEANTKQSASGYHCLECGGELSKGQTPCPGCGARLDWGALNG